MPYHFHTSKFPKWIFHMHNSTLARLIMYAFGFCWCYTEQVYLSLSPWKTQNRCNALKILYKACVIYIRLPYNIGQIFMQAYPMWTEICWYILFIFVTWQEFATVKYFQLGLFTVCNVNTFNVITSVDISSGYERQLAAAHNVK